MYKNHTSSPLKKEVLVHQSLNQAKSSPKKRTPNVVRERLDLRFANLETGNRDLRDQILRTEERLHSTKQQLLNMHGLRSRRQRKQQKRYPQVWESEKVLLEAKIQRLERKLKEVGSRHQAELKKAYSDLSEVQHTVLEFRNQKDAFQEEKKRFNQKLKAKDSDDQTVQAKLRKFTEYQEESERKIEELKLKLEKSVDDEERVGEIVRQATKKVRDEHEATVADMQTIVESLEQQLLTQKNRFEAYESEISKLRGDLQMFQSTVDSYKKEEEEWFAQTEVWQRQQDVWGEERTLMQEQIAELQSLVAAETESQATIHQLEAEVEVLRGENETLASSLSDMDNLTDAVTSLKSDNQMLLSDLQAQNRELESMESRICDDNLYEEAKKIELLEATNREYCAKIHILENELKRCASKSEQSTQIQTIELLETRNSEYCARIEMLQNELQESAERSEQNRQAIISNLREDIICLQSERDELQIECHQHKQNSHDLEDAIMDLEDELAKQKLKRREEEEIRRKLHNEVVELRGNIRVLCRVRPFLSDEVPECNFSFPMDNPFQNQLWLKGPDSCDVFGVTKPGARHHFEFDRVFQAQEGQKEVFSEIQHLVQSALDGYKVCIFAFGQTGSGKTYTMEGRESGEECGMIPRAVQHIFNYQEELKEKGWQFEFQASSLEIYNEHISDLLSSDPRAYLDISQRGKEVGVEGLTHVSVSSPEEVYPLLERAKQNRSVGCTDLNTHSSRSHLIFQIFLNGRNIHSQQERHGVLNLIDLAGSERLKNSNAEGIRREETKYINKSLSALADVIGALGKKNKHIPYRNSKLTFLLQNYLGGDAKTLMFVNLCPGVDKLDQSLCSLRFASRVNATELGTARRMVERQRSSFGSRSPVNSPRHPKTNARNPGELKFASSPRH